MPCLTAFSKSGCRRRGGTATSSVEASTFSNTDEPVAEADALHGEIAVREREFFAKGDRGALRHAERRPQEVREERAHRARSLPLAGPDEGRDRVQAVEEEVRVVSLPERVKLGLAGASVRRSAARRSSSAGLLRRVEHVVHREDEQVEEDAEQENDRAGPGETVGQGLEDGEESEPPRERRPGQEPQRSRGALIRAAASADAVARSRAESTGKARHRYQDERHRNA